MSVATTPKASGKPPQRRKSKRNLIDELLEQNPPEPEVEKKVLVNDYVRNSAEVNTKKIYQKICEWYTSWAPWQKRKLLCSLTNMCSTSQLESLATTLEPIFHRDFVTQVKKRYPSASFKYMKELARRELELEMANQKDEDNLQDEFPDEAIVMAGDATEQKETNILDNELFKEIIQFEKNNPNENGNEEDDDDDGETDNKKVYAFAEKVVGNVLRGAMETIAESVTEDLVSNQDVISGRKEKPDANLAKDANWHYTKDLVGGKSKVKLKPERKKSQKIDETPSLSRFNIYSWANMDIGTLGEHMLFDPKFSAQHHNALASLHITANPFLVRSLDTTLFNSYSAHSRHKSSRNMQSAHGTVDFLLKEERSKRLAPFQAQLRTGQVNKPFYVEDITVPVQNMFKSVKFYGESPRPGNEFIRPEKRKLRAIFNEQITQIFIWMEDWQEHERLHLFALIIKMSDADLISYMAQCLFQRLQERVNINWLSDRNLLLIFSYLQPQDIDSCAQVCQRWKHLCAIDELWMVKCMELGASQGIRDLAQVVTWANPSKRVGGGIDWRLAYEELTGITQHAAATVPTLTIDSLTYSDGEGQDAPSKKGMKKRGKGKNGATSSRDSSAVSNVPSWKRMLPLEEGLAPELGLAAKLVKESEKLKQAYRDELNATARTHEEKSEGEFSGDVSPSKSQRLGMFNLRRAKRSESGFSLPRQGSGAEYLDMAPHNGGGDAGANGMSRRNTNKNGELAQDVRLELVQAQDIMGKWNPQSHRWHRSHGLNTSHTIKKFKLDTGFYTADVSPVRRVRKFMGFMDSVLVVEYDKRRLFGGAFDGSIRIWDIRSGHSIRKIHAHKGGVSCLVFDRTTLYSGSWDTAVMVWDIVHFKRLAVLTGHRGSISALCMDDAHLYSASHDGTVRLWLRETNECLKTLSIHQSHIMSMVLDGGYIVTGSSDQTIKITDVGSMETVRVIKTNDPVHKMIIHHRLIISINPNGHLFFWDKETGHAEVAIQAHDNQVSGLAYCDGHFYTASYSDNVIKEWDLTTLTCLRMFSGHQAPINDIKVDEKKLISCDSAGHIRVWDFYIPILAPEVKPGDEVIMPTILHESELKAQQEPPAAAEGEGGGGETKPSQKDLVVAGSTGEAKTPQKDLVPSGSTPADRSDGGPRDR